MSNTTPNHPKNALLSDLESIRSLLDEEASAAHAAAARPEMDAELDISADPQVPLLEDVVAGAFSLDEAPLRERALLDGDAGGMDDELFQALLGDQWKTSAARILKDASDSIEEVREQWSPEDTDTLNHALRVRIDDTIQYWLRGLVTRNLDDLRAHLLSATHDQLRQSIVEILSAKPELTGTWKSNTEDTEDTEDG